MTTFGATRGTLRRAAAAITGVELERTRTPSPTHWRLLPVRCCARVRQVSLTRRSARPASKLHLLVDTPTNVTYGHIADVSLQWFLTSEMINTTTWLVNDGVSIANGSVVFCSSSSFSAGLMLVLLLFCAAPVRRITVCRGLTTKVRCLASLPSCRCRSQRAGVILLGLSLAAARQQTPRYIDVRTAQCTRRPDGSAPRSSSRR